MSSAVWSAAFAGVSATAAIVTAIIAVTSLVGSRKDSRDRTRPVVIASLRKGPSISHGTSYLVIENAGRSVAKAIEVSFEPPLPDYKTTPDGQQGVVAPFLRRRYAEPITMLAPGHGLRNLYSYLSVGVDGNVEPVPDRFTVTLKYVDDRGRKYQDSFPLDLGQLKLETASNPSDTGDTHRRQSKALEAIVWELWE